MVISDTYLLIYYYHHLKLSWLDQFWFAQGTEKLLFFSANKARAPESMDGLNSSQSLP